MGRDATRSMCIQGSIHFFPKRLDEINVRILSFDKAFEGRIGFEYCIAVKDHKLSQKKLDSLSPIERQKTLADLSRAKNELIFLLKDIRSSFSNAVVRY